MITNENRRTYYDDEISLVDLAATFLRRRRVFYAVFVGALLAGIGYAIFAPEKYDYISLVKLAENNSQDYIEAPSSVIAELENHWLPMYAAEFHAANDRKLPVDVRFSNPDNTGLVRLVTEASRAQVEAVEKVHGQLIKQLEREQADAVSKLRQNLEERIKSLDATIEMLRGTQDSGGSIAAAVEQRLSLQAELDSTRPMETLVVARQGSDRKGIARSLIVILAGVLGLFAGVFLAFFAEFVGLVKDRVAEA